MEGSLARLPGCPVSATTVLSNASILIVTAVAWVVLVWGCAPYQVSSVTAEGKVMSNAAPGFHVLTVI